MMREMDFVDECYADKDLSLLKKLTLVIPTYNRNYYLSRCLWYHAHFPFGEIIVADSSPEEKKVVNRETVQKIREMFGANIRYLEYEPETEKYGGDIYRKWGDAVQHVETEYSQIVTDKEFLIPTTVNQCIEYLEQHHDYSSSMGIRYNLERGKKLRSWSPHVLSFEDETILERLQEYNNAEYPDELFLSIQRTENHKIAYQNIEKYNIDDIRFGECTLELQTLIFGKTKRFSDKVGKIRDITNLKKMYILTNRNDSSSTRYPLLNDYPNKRMDSLNQKFRDCIINTTDTIKKNKSDTADNEIIESIIKNIIYWWFCGDEYRKKTLKSSYYLFQKYPQIYRIYLNIPKNIRNWLAQNYIKYKEKNQKSHILCKEELDIVLIISEKSEKYYTTDNPILL